jgi:hypothetical protein
MNIDQAFPSNYIKASDLAGRAVAVVIDRVAVEEVGRNKDTKPVLYFRGKEKGLVLNRTNSNKISEIAGSKDTEDWAGVTVAIYPTTTEFGGETVECIRVKAVPPRQQQPAPAPKPQPVAPPAEDLGGGVLTEDDIPFARMPSF